MEIANSHPEYIITDGRMQLLNKCSFYGKSGLVLESDTNRMVCVEVKGCANIIRGFMAKKF